MRSQGAGAERLPRHPAGDWSAQRVVATLGHLDQTEWQSRIASGPSPADRGGHAWCTLDGGRTVLVHGGANGDVLHSDTFVLRCEPFCDALQWHRLEAKG